MDVPASLPPFLRSAFADVEDTSHAFCKKCKTLAATCVETSNDAYRDGECYELCCGNNHCKATVWAFCKSCNKSFTKRNLPVHVKSKDHGKNTQSRYAAVPGHGHANTTGPGHDNTTPPVNDDNVSNEDVNTNEFPPTHPVLPADAQTSPSLGSFSTGIDNSLDNGGEIDLESGGGVFLDTLLEKETNPAQSVEPIINADETTHPKLSLKGNEKLDQFFRNTPRAPVEDLLQSFDDLALMRHFWSAEHASPPGRCGGGLQYLVGRAFSRPVSGLISVDKVPTIDESLFQLQCFSQYLSMNDTQRKRQATIMQSLHKGTTSQRSYSSNNSKSHNKMFESTYVPSYKEAEKIFGRNGQHSMWNNLPIPPIQNVDGIGYANPVHILKFLFSCGVPVDDIFVNIGCKETYEDGSTVHHVSQSRKASEFVKDILEAQKEAHRKGETFCLATWLADWRDGFGPNRTKGNRNSVVAWTITISPPKNKVNATTNTFLVALGSKKNSAWPKVEHRFRMDLAKLQDLCNPLKVYHGTLQKVIPVCSRRFASLEDKVERPDVTATIACASDYHRCFGTSVRIATPKCDNVRMNRKQFQYEKAGGRTPHPGWSDEFAVRGNTNGSKLPSCLPCRRRIWKQLFRQQPTPHQDNANCSECTNWEVCGETASHLLKHDPPKDYPKQLSNNDCPLPVPEGRPVPAQFLIPVKLSFEYLIGATRFTFYHACAKGKKRWGLGACRAYLRTCGVGSNHQELLLEATKQAIEDDLPIDYNDPEGIGSFRFPASWIGDLSLHQYIELAMHQLFLGIAKSNFELVNKWIKGSGFGTSKLKKRVNPLLNEIKKLQLSFALTHELTGVDGTGSWVSENWLALVRFSKTIYSCLCENEKCKKNGVEDVTRLVSSYNALVSRLLSHSGVNPSNIQEIHLYMKEFLSCTRELDIRVRHRELGIKSTRKKSTKSKQETKKKKATGEGGKKKKKKKTNQVNQQSISAEAVTTNSRKRKAPVVDVPADKVKDTGEVVVTGVTEQQGGDQTTGKEAEAWWLKPNYMSLLNLIESIAELGPLVLWWDGGGKGERFIQDIKPHIPRGVRNDQTFFYVRLTERVYKMRCLFYLENRYFPQDDEESDFDMLDMVESAISDSEMTDDEDSNSESDNETIVSESGREDATDDGESDEEDDNNYDTLPTTSISQVEDSAMHKARTIYIYRSEATLIRALNDTKPITGIVIQNSEQTSYDMFCIYRKANAMFGWRKIIFFDSNGANFHGLWHAPILLEEEKLPPSSKLAEVQRRAKMSAIAIPLRYIVGKGHDRSRHYGVQTNWWKERDSRGEYVLPRLDPCLYEDNPSDNNMNSIDNMLNDPIDTKDSSEDDDQSDAGQPHAVI